MAPIARNPGLTEWMRLSCVYQPLAPSTVLELARQIARRLALGQECLAELEQRALAKMQHRLQSSPGTGRLWRSA